MSWIVASRALHERVLEGALDSLARDLVLLHQPHPEEGMPVCHGCDRGSIMGLDAVWPCRSYTVLAGCILRIKDVESYLQALRGSRSAKLTG